MTSIIRTEQLTKSYGARRGIVDVDLEVAEGEVFGFLGPNGAGKTTTIRTLLDLIRPSHGRAFIFGIESTADPVAIHQRVGYLPGEFTLYDRLTGGQTIQYFANLRGGVDGAYQTELIERLELDPSRRFREYSKGNKQKVGLIVALQHRPDLLVLDEPTSGLDPLVQQTFYQLVREAQADGRTVFLSSHILGEVEHTCDRVGIIRQGRLVRTGRDSRRAFLIVTVLLAGLMLAVGAGIQRAYPTQAARDDMVRIATGLGQGGLTSKPLNADTVGGWVQWKYGADFLWIAALWSILALSSTLTAEARRGSLDVLVMAPLTRRRIAFEKIAAHVTMLALTCLTVGFTAWLASATFATLPGDAIRVPAAAGLAVWMGLGAVSFGALAFVLAPFLGRGAAVGSASFVLFAGWVLSDVQATGPIVRALAALTPWGWTASHLPLAGQYDWLSQVPVALAAAVLLTLGVEAFARRDVGAAPFVNLPGLPTALLGLRGPFGRAFAERLPTALGWAAGMGIVGAVAAAASSAIAGQMANLSPETVRLFRGGVLPIDVTTPDGLLEFGIIQVGFLAIGFAAATLVSGWAADEIAGRLDLLLATPLTRSRWALAGGIGVYLAIALITLVLGLGVGIGARLAGIDALRPMLATGALACFAAAVAGVGLAVGGVARTSVAATVVTALVAITLAIEWFAPVLRLPGWVHQLALTAHLGQPMLGLWDWSGMIACLALAVFGLAISAWGISRRDLAT